MPCHTIPCHLLPIFLATISFCNISIKVHRIACTRFPVPKDCDEWFERGFTDDGVYTVDPDGKGSFKVRCEMTEKIWTVFQRRIDGTVNFNRSWNSYKNGFGNLEKEFWLGLEKIHRLTNAKQRSLRVDLWDFDGNNASAVYGSFSIKNETDCYELAVSNFSGMFFL